MGCGASNDGRDKNEEKKKKSEAATGRPSEEKYLELKDSIERCINKNKADLVFKNGKIVNVFSGEILEQDLAIHNGKIIGCGNYEGFREINLEGKMVLPGFIDGHIHIESSMLSPYEFSKAVVPKGTTTVIADPHEITNVMGLEGINYMLEATENLPLNSYFMLPSCVPATSFESSGAVLEAADYNEIIKHKRVLGLGEMMNYPGVLNCERKVLEKLVLCTENNKIIDGHAPDLLGNQINALSYAKIHTDHECATVEEMKERIRKGMYVAIREGSACKDLKQLVKGVDQWTERRCIFCTDDKHSEDILQNGHINYNIKLAIQYGIHPMAAIRMATCNVAQCYGLKDVGAIAPNYLADIVIIDNFDDFNILEVYKSGKKVAENEQRLFEITQKGTTAPKNSVHIKKITKEMLKIELTSNKINTLKVSPGTIVTEKETITLENAGDEFIAKNHTEHSLLKMFVIERHHNTGNMGYGIISNFGLKNGAIAQTLAHDSHNLIVIGDNDEDMLLAIEEIVRVQGGMTLVSEGAVLKTLGLEIGGLMSNRNIQELTEISSELLRKAREMGVTPGIEPFMTLGFLALPVIPQVRVTDKGFFDVSQFKFINVCE